jgi:DNA-binding response OmpR family regulator
MKNQPETAKRILSIEDETSIQELITIYLEDLAGWEVLQATNGQDGLDLAKAEKIDAILLDVMMPKLNGIEIFRCLKADPKTQDIPVLFVTSKLKLKDPKNLLDLSHAKIISKPFDFEQLANRIEAELEAYHQNQNHQTNVG